MRRRWDDGTLLTALAQGNRFEVLDLPIRGPTATDLANDLGAAQAWVAELVAGSRLGRAYALEYRSIGGRHIGRNQIPARARLTDFDQAWRLLGTTAEVESYQRILELVAATPPVHGWVVAHPMKALAAAEDWPQLLAAYHWLDQSRGTARYLREITAPGVDTKFVERHRPLLGALLGVSASSTGFVAGLGLRFKPDTVRLRLDPTTLGLPAELSELTLRVGELAALPGQVKWAMIIENEITFLSVPIPDHGMILWGKGFEVDRAGSLPWLTAAEVSYWGDLDSHGFGILNQLRAWLPQTKSILMDRETLLTHRDRWGTEPAPTRARLDRLDPAESTLYADLVSDRYGDRVRLEQERLAWDWVLPRLTTRTGA